MLVATKKKKVLRIIEFNPKNNRTIREFNYVVGEDITYDQAQMQFRMKTMLSKSDNQFRFDLVTYELNIIDEDKIDNIGPKNYKMIEYERLIANEN